LCCPEFTGGAPSFRLHGEKMPDTKEILAWLEGFMRATAPRLSRLEGYYLGQHGILQPPKEALKPDNRLVNGFCRSITDCTVGYFMGRGVQYSSDDSGLAAAAARVSTENDERFVNNALARDLSVCGRAAELLWYEDIEHPRFTPAEITSVFPVYSSDAEPRLLYAVRYYRNGEDGSMTVEVYDAEAVHVYLYDGRALLHQKSTAHFFGEVPVIFYDNNRDRQGDFEPVLSLIDAYDRLQSASVNDFELFADSYLAISGMGGTDEENLARIRRERVILLDDGGEAKWLTKNANDAYIENLKSRIAKDIYRFSGTVDMAEETLAGSALSGIAIRYRLLNFENRVAVTEQYFRRGLRRRWRLIIRLLSLAGGSYDASALTMHFTRNLPGMPEEAADMAQKLSGILSRRSVIEQLPMVEGADTEMERIRLEEADGMLPREEHERCLREARAQWEGEAAGELDALRTEIARLESEITLRKAEARCAEKLRSHGLPEHLTPFLLYAAGAEDDAALEERTALLAEAIREAPLAEIRRHGGTGCPGSGVQTPMSGAEICQTPIAKLAQMMRGR